MASIERVIYLKVSVENIRPLKISEREISADLPGKERQGKKRKIRKRRKIENMEGGKFKMEVGKGTK